MDWETDKWGMTRGTTYELVIGFILQVFYRLIQKAAIFFFPINKGSLFFFIQMRYKILNYPKILGVFHARIASSS